MRDAMTDDEFWAHVGANLASPHWEDEDAGPDLDPSLNVGLCETCGESGACAYDSEGHALIHATPSEETP